MSDYKSPQEMEALATELLAIDLNLDMPEIPALSVAATWRANKMTTQLKERPVVFTTEEVNAVLAGDKTQHRAPLSSQPCIDNNGRQILIINGVCVSEFNTNHRPFDEAVKRILPRTTAAPYSIGDRLWVQEEHRPIGWLLDDGEVMIEYRDGYSTSYNYLTEEELETNPNDDYPLAVIDELLARKIPINEHTDRFDFSNPENLPHWRSANVMPQFASRALLKITDIRIERVQDITLGDSLKEARDGLMDFAADYWIAKHGEAAWFTNPWVWVVEFKKAEG